MTIQDALTSGKRFFKRPPHRHWYEQGQVIFGHRPVIIALSGEELAFTVTDLLATDWEVTNTIDEEKQWDAIDHNPFSDF